MSLATVLEFNKPEKVKTNNVLLEIARKVVNSSPEPRYKIKLRDDVLAMKEKERLGFNFNRSVTASLKSRWDVVESATKDYLEEILDMNDQIEEDGRKYENQLINLIVTRTTNLGLNSRIEQMAGLFMHMNFYCTVLKFKIQHLEATRAFMFTCSDLMGFSRPSQIIDRFSALQHVFTELYVDYEERQNLLNHLTETLSEVKAETNHRNMLMHNQMAEMHSRIKKLQTESAQLERAIIDQMESSTGASLEIYKIKNAVYNIYVTMMAYRGLEATQSDSFGQLDELEVRISHTQAAVKMLQAEEAKRQSKKKQHKKSEASDITTLGDTFSDDESDLDSDIRSTKNQKTNPEHVTFSQKPNVSANKSVSLKADLSVVPKMSMRSNVPRPPSVRLEAGLATQQNLSLPPIVSKRTFAGANQNRTPSPDISVTFPRLDASANKTGRQLNVKRRNCEASKSTERLCPQETSTPTASDSQALATFTGHGNRERRGHMSGVATSGPTRLSEKCEAVGKRSLNVARLQSKSQKQSTEMGPVIKREMEYHNVEEITAENSSSNYTIDLSDGDCASVIDQLDENPAECVNTSKEKKASQKTTAIQTRNGKSISSRNVSYRSNSLKEVNTKRVQILTKIASRRNLKEHCLNILSKEKPRHDI